MKSQLFWRLIWLGFLILVFSWPTVSQAEGPLVNNILEEAGYDQRLDEQVPLDLRFLDESGASVPLSNYFSEGKPVIIAMGYFECRTLCPLVREGLLYSVAALDFNVGEEFNLVLVSIDPRETPAVAAKVKPRYVSAYNRPNGEAGWNFLTGEEEAIHALADAIGFRYLYDEATDQYAHASGLTIVTPEGKISSYLFGVEYIESDLRLALVDAAAGGIGSVVDQLLLLCYHYDPTTGKYSLLVMNVLRLAATFTVLMLGVAILFFLRAERRQGPPSTPTGTLNPI